MKYLLYFAMAVIIFFLGFNTGNRFLIFKRGNKKVTVVQEKTVVPQTRVAENKISYPSIISRDPAESVKKNSTPRFDQKEKQHPRETEQKVTQSQERTEVKAVDEAINNDVPPEPPPHLFENEDELGVAATNAFANYAQYQEMSYSMEEAGIAEEDIENMIGSMGEEYDQREYMNPPRTPEELEQEILASFIDAGVPPEDKEVMLRDLMMYHMENGDVETPEEPPLPDAAQNEEIDKQF